jgi:hypothetical protein
VSRSTASAGEVVPDEVLAGSVDAGVGAVEGVDLDEVKTVSRAEVAWGAAYA